VNALLVKCLQLPATTDDRVGWVSAPSQERWIGDERLFLMLFELGNAAF